MPLRAPLADDVVAEIWRRVRAGEVPKAIAIDLGISKSTVHAYIAHLPLANEPKREARRLAILACLEAGLDVHATAEKAQCTIRDVVRLIWAINAEAAYRTPEQRAADEDAREAARRERARARREATSPESRQGRAAAKRAYYAAHREEICARNRARRAGAAAVRRVRHGIEEGRVAQGLEETRANVLRMLGS